MTLLFTKLTLACSFADNLHADQLAGTPSGRGDLDLPIGAADPDKAMRQQHGTNSAEGNPNNSQLATYR